MSETFITSIQWIDGTSASGSHITHSLGRGDEISFAPIIINEDGTEFERIDSHTNRRFHLENMVLLITKATYRYNLTASGSRVQIPVVNRGFCDEQLQLITGHGCLYIVKERPNSK
jgi:hypothetical protein